MHSCISLGGIKNWHEFSAKKEKQLQAKSLRILTTNIVHTLCIPNLGQSRTHTLLRKTKTEIDKDQV